MEDWLIAIEVEQLHNLSVRLLRDHHHQLVVVPLVLPIRILRVHGHVRRREGGRGRDKKGTLGGAWA